MSTSEADVTAADIIASLAAKSDQLNAIDLVGGPITVRITACKKGPDPKQPVNVYLSDRKVPWRPCLTERRVLTLMWSADPKVWVGRRVTLWRDPDVEWASKKAGGVRLLAASHLNGRWTGEVPATRGKTCTRTVEALADDPTPPKSQPIRAPVDVPTWAAEGDAGLTDEQVGEVVALLASRSLTVAKVEQSMGPAADWTAETVRAIVGRLNAGGGR